MARTPARSPATAGTRAPFVLLCLYLLCQGFTIPVVAAGPSWAIWPTLADVAVIFVLAAAVLAPRTAPRSADATRTLRWLLLLIAGCAVSYGALTIGGIDPLPTSSARRGPLFGLFGFYRLAQGAILFWASTRIVLNESRAILLRRIATGVLLFVSLGVVLTFFSIVDPSTLVAHLPSSLEVAGPWGFFSRTDQAGLGTIGYNHAYVTSQAILLLILRMHFLRRQPGALDFALIGCVVLVCFLSGSRAGLAAVLFFAFVMLGKNVLTSVLMGILAFSVLLSVPREYLFSDELILMMEHQSALLDPADPASLSGRQDIWTSTLEFMNERPLRWLTGIGFGSAADGPGHSHMLYFQIILECGIFALAAYLVVVTDVLRRLRSREAAPKAVFWGTLALLLSSLTQETFYPVPAFGGFLPFYLTTLALAFRPGGLAPRAERAPS